MHVATAMTYIIWLVIFVRDLFSMWKLKSQNFLHPQRANDVSNQCYFKLPSCPNTNRGLSANILLMGKGGRGLRWREEEDSHKFLQAEPSPFIPLLPFSSVKCNNSMLTWQLLPAKKAVLGPFSIEHCYPSMSFTLLINLNFSGQHDIQLLSLHFCIIVLCSWPLHIGMYVHRCLLGCMCFVRILNLPCCSTTCQLHNWTSSCI